MKSWLKKKLFRILAYFVVNGLLAAALSGQTMVNASGSTKCPGLTGASAASAIVSVGVTGTVAGLPVVVFTCAQLDPAGFALDKTTTPWTIRAITNSPASSSLHVEVPSGVLNGTNANFTLSATPAAGLPVLIYRNGLLLMACPMPLSASCNGDYQVAGTTLLFLTAAQTTAGVSAIPNGGDLIQAVYWH